jgi:putative sigma-54 modulation protein
MRLMLTGRNVDITPTLRQQVTRHLSKIERVLDNAAMSAQVVLTREKFRHVTDVTVFTRGDHTLSGMGDATTWPASMKTAVLKIEQQAKKVKGKWTTRKRRATGAKRLPVPTEAVVPSIDAEAVGPRVIRARHLVRTLTLDEAKARLAKTRDEFLVFRHRDTGRTAVLVRRDDGNYGLIEPEA